MNKTKDRKTWGKGQRRAEKWKKCHMHSFSSKA